MLKLGCKIIIEGTKKWEFTACRSVEIVQAVESLTDTCVLLLPRKIKWQGASGDKPPIRKGDKISVYLGYNGKLSLRFAGFVRTVTTKSPVKIECEDNMFLLKTTEVKPMTFRKASLKEVITYLLDGTGMKFDLLDEDIILGNYRLTKNTVAEQLAELKKEFGLSAYFRIKKGANKQTQESILHVGFSYPFDGNTEHFAYGKNLIQEDLQYNSKEDVILKVKGISVQENGERIEVTCGNEKGELRTVFHHNISKEELTKFALAELERFKYSGYKGNFLTFGEPMIRKTDIVKLKTENGEALKHLAKAVTVTFGTEGYRQKIELGPKFNSDPS